MTETLITNGRIVTQNESREVIEDGAVAIRDDEIAAVGPTDRLKAQYDPDRRIDATGSVVIPGLINAHTHVSDILLRGSFTEDRGLYDWLYNVKRPAVLSMTPEEHRVAATLYCLEALQAGVTTFVENDTEVTWDNWKTTEAKLSVYNRAGVRNIYAAGFTDIKPDAEFWSFVTDVQERNPATESVSSDRLHTDTETALAEIEALIQAHHGGADGRQSVWPAPSILVSSSKQGLRGAYDLAQKYDVMTTTHVAEAEVETLSLGQSSIEYLRNVGYLGDRALLGHCVQIDQADVRLLARTGTTVAHNYMANMRLATGYAPVVKMQQSGVTVGLGTDNAELSDTVNPLSDARAAAAGHKGYHREPDVFEAGDVFDMVTINAASAIGRADDIGSIESGKQADLAIIDFDHPHLTPAPNPVFSLVHNVQGFEVDTVLCAGAPVMTDREVVGFDKSRTDITRQAADVGEAIVSRVGIE